MAGFLISKSNNKYKIIINRELVDTFIDELAPFAKFFGVTFLEKTNYICASVESEPFSKSIFLKNNTFALSVEIEDDKKDIANTISLKEWSVANMILGNFYLSKNEIGKYRPLEINYDIQRVSFDKGCFRGQEIIARMKYLGVDRRRFCTIISKTEIKEEKNLKIIGESIKLKDSFICLSIIKKDSLEALTQEDPSIQII
ncbi:tRNA-modifying protein YgfZ [Gammaproteobacteria bacterium]|nr:tRNA-modifying protein YgfZ [Gammaproteobacteria bacterium]